MFEKMLGNNDATVMYFSTIIIVIEDNYLINQWWKYVLGKIEPSYKNLNLVRVSSLVGNFELSIGQYK